MNTQPALIQLDGSRGVDVLVREPKAEAPGIGFRMVTAVGGLVDDALSVVAPAAAMKRTMARRAYLSQRGYNAADKNRLNGHRMPTLRDADTELQNKQGRIRSFARDEVRNNAVAKNLKRTHGNNVCGDADVGQGVTIDPAVIGPGGKPMAEVNKALKECWKRYRDHLEFTGRWGFADMVRLNDSELTEAGEALGTFHDRPAPGSDLPLSVEILEADRLPMDTDMFLSGAPLTPGEAFHLAGPNGMPVTGPDGKPEKHFIKHGIEYTEQKQIAAFHILEDHPGSFHIASRRSWRTQRWSREKVFHYFAPERAEQTRGVSKFVSALPLISDLRDLIEWELVSVKAQAIFGVHFNGSVDNVPYPSGTMNPPKDATGNPVVQLQSGMMTSGPQKAEFYQGNRPGGTFLPFFQSLMRLAGAAFGIGYSATSKDYSQGAYSALRQEDNEDGREYQGAQGLHARHFCQPLWSKFVRACVLAGKIPVSAAQYESDRARYERCEINVPGRKHINPLQEITAEAVAVKNGFKDLDEVPNTSSTEPEDRLRKLGDQKRLAEKEGLMLGWATGEIKPPLNHKPQQDGKDPGDNGAVSKEQLAGVGVQSDDVGDADEDE